MQVVCWVHIETASDDDVTICRFELTLEGSAVLLISMGFDGNS